MATKYKIYLVNLKSNAKKFWCFLEQPISQVSSEVYANSSAFITVPEYDPQQTNSFTIPLQYKVGVGASNKAVGLNTLVDSNSIADTDLEQGWLATYTQDGTNTGPVLTEDGTANRQQIRIGTNLYDKAQEPIDKWYGNMTFGIESEQGFIGMTWSPDPSETYMIEPKVNFYVATGNYQENELASISAISTTAAHVTENSFDGARECTVTLNTDGSWTVTKGQPNPNLVMLNQLVAAHYMLVDAHRTLIGLAQLQAPSGTSISQPPAIATRTSEGVIVKQQQIAKKQDVVLPLFGSLTVGTTLATGFAFMIAGGISLNITGQSASGTQFDFRYDGPASRAAILEAFRAGTQVAFVSGGN